MTSALCVTQGNKEGQSKFQRKPSAWSAFRTADYGFTIMDIIDSTHLALNQVSIEKVTLTFIFNFHLTIFIVKNVSFVRFKDNTLTVRGKLSICLKI